MGFFSLPIELRNEIMHYLHVPELIHTEGVSSDQHRSRRAADLQISYRSLLSTIRHFRNIKDREGRGVATGLVLGMWSNHCSVILNGWSDCFLPFDKVTPGYLSVSSEFRRETYHEFWTQSEFVLPPGPLEHTEHYFSRFQPEHRQLIRRIAIDISWTDLTPEVLSIIEQHAAVAKAANPDPTVWGACVAMFLATIWRGKLAWIRDHSNAKEVRIMSRKLVHPSNGDAGMLNRGALCSKMMVFRDTSLSEIMNGIDCATPCVDCYGSADEVLADCMRNAEGRVLHIIAYHVVTVSWNFAKAWIRQFSLYNGEFDFDGELYEVNGPTARQQLN
ncbi:MAG: hypothetical protein LQ351_007791 [Letrouitia transgressa]|nr:MAG: hypothetical protein LQ351_007791 [Letrouitia transgressa]